MSGVCGIVQGAGAPVERRLLEEMTASMAFRGPDAQSVWIGEGAGLGHTMLRTTFEADGETQPASIDGKVWISADARIDDREGLRARLAVLDLESNAKATDAELILLAYTAWGEDCPRHLIGDFSFAIWDAPRARLFCARDHFGVKPFFYAQCPAGLVFSNTLDCVRLHPAVSESLDESYIADFLVFEMSQDPAASAFLNIRRLPPAHSLTFDAGGRRVRPYWTLPAFDEVRYRAAGDYVEHFRELLGIAVDDRLRVGSATVEMSGGMDSTAVAAAALNLRPRHAVPVSLRASTYVFDRILPDEERKFAALAARTMGIEVDFHTADDFALFAEIDSPGRRFPEPWHEPDAAVSMVARTRIGARCRVLLTGWDGDALLHESPKPYFRSLARQRSLVRLVLGTAGYAIAERRILPHGWLGSLSPGGQLPARPDTYPSWLNPDLERKLQVRKRWEAFAAPRPTGNTVRPYAHRIYDHVMRSSNFFDFCDPAVTRVALECRHPLFDLRLLEFCLSLPTYPWCVRKHILREAMRGLLPEEVRLRPKTPLQVSTIEPLLKMEDSRWVDDFAPVPALAAYVDRARVPKVWGPGYSDDAWTNLRPLSLNFWLQNLHRRPKPGREPDERIR